MARTLTAADAVITLTIPGIFSTPQQLQGFSTDNVYDIGNLVIAETAMGVDGTLSAGFVFNPIEQTFTLQANSISNDLFDLWYTTSQQAKDVFRCTGSTTLPAVGKTYVSNNGVLMTMPPLPGANKILSPRKYVIQWQSIVGNPI